MSDYTQVNYVFLALGLINGTLFVLSELFGFLNRHNLRSKSFLELIGRWLKILREPSFDEVLEHLKQRRESLPPI
jgi:hypothetical protein